MEHGQKQKSESLEERAIEPSLAQLLGLGNTPVEWPYSEEALVALIQLQKEKEVTKQQFFRSELLTKSLELMNRALAVSVPPALIPSLFSGETPNDELLMRLASQQPQQPQQATPDATMAPPTPLRQPQAQPMPMQRQANQPPPPQPHMIPQQMRQAPPIPSPQRTLYSGYHQPQQMPQPTQTYGNLGPPVSFQQQALQRPNSPAKIGAAAVAQLEKRYPTSPAHKRTMSTPVFHQTPVPNIHVHSPVQQHQPAGGLMGTMNQIQFINENPGKKRRRDSRDLDDEADATEDEGPSETEKKKDTVVLPKPARMVKHARSRSEQFTYNPDQSSSKTRKSESAMRTEELKTGTAPKVGPLVKKFEEGNATPSSGPKFANNILSSV
ncbi:CYFA0S02e04060g1_1 [Cyberlindnera fabianii]|uniref:CYFA0S02e04060g1_1 n=1 Tax=Cyberlindnera fabianii TaxID=36022 RepID=A0A061AM75_CYBFA|nr:Protein BOP3 [Cyberlindnera fabianii]CDR38646.1 CYFA0S02e04060g1_1 [Cyberlindnera fabianii]